MTTGRAPLALAGQTMTRARTYVAARRRRGANQSERARQNSMWARANVPHSQVASIQKLITVFLLGDLLIRGN